MEIHDRIRDEASRVAALRAQHEREVARLARARSDYDKTEEQLEQCTASLALAEAGVDAVAAAAPSPGSSGGNVGGANLSRAERDARMLKSTDVPAIAERVLELQLLESSVERSVSDALSCAREWEERAEEAQAAVKRAEEDLAAVPESERGSLVTIVEAVSEQNRIKRRLQGEMDDIRRAHDEKLDMRRYEVNQLRDTLSGVDVKLGQVRGDVRLVERERQSYEARLETMVEQRLEYRERLLEFVGDDNLLRVSFKRYDTNQSGSLDAEEIFAATQEVLRIAKDDDVADSFTLQDAIDQVDAYDKNGNGSLDFREFKKMFQKLIKASGAEVNSRDSAHVSRK